MKAKPMWRQKISRMFLMALLAAGLTPLFSAAIAAPEAELWPRWQSHALTRTIEVDHEPWNAFLSRYVVTRDGMNLMSYGAVNADDRAALDDYIATLEATDVDNLTRDQQFAFWVNLYNAATVRVVLDHYPVDSIRDIDISPGLFSNGPWGAKILTVAEESLSLDDIEHRILRPIWQDPRIHYVVNCAAMGCPELARQPYRADNLDAMLEVAARAFVNHPRGVTVEAGKLSASRIYKWYRDDFGRDDADLIAHLKRYARPALVAKLDTVTRIRTYKYNWLLNDASP